MGLAGWLTSDVIFGLIGMLIGMGTWAVNAYYKRKADKRRAEYERRADERDEHEYRLRMKREYGTEWERL